MFQGYSNEAFEFFMAIRFNNNRAFFQENRDWYLRAVREPSLALAQDLNALIEEIDPEMERRPHRTLSRINRDIRFSKDKSPYRDHVWMAFRRPGPDRGGVPGLYFQLEVERGECGMGFYHENRLMMDGLRARMAQRPDEMLALLDGLKDDYSLYLDQRVRMAVPESLPEALVPIYRARSLYFFRRIEDFELIKSPQLANALAADYRRLTPMYRYIMNFWPDENRL